MLPPWGTTAMNRSLQYRRIDETCERATSRSYAGERAPHLATMLRGNPRLLCCLRFQAKSALSTVLLHPVYVEWFELMLVCHDTAVERQERAEVADVCIGQRGELFIARWYGPKGTPQRRPDCAHTDCAWHVGVLHKRVFFFNRFPDAQLEAAVLPSTAVPQPRPRRRAPRDTG